MNIPRIYPQCSFIVLLIYSAIGSGDETLKIAANESALIQQYKDRICQLADSCDLVDQVPAVLNDLRTRNCMCDEKCAIYKDCCPDSMQPAVDIDIQFTCVKTPFDDGVYMINTCPDTWNDTKITHYCSATNEKHSSDILLYLPVTSKSNGVTYGNVFCAICNEENNYDFWNVGFTYEYIPSNQQSNANTIDGSNASLEDILDRIEFNKTGELYWSSTVNGSFYKCHLRPKIPSQIDSVRYCVPNVTDTCGDTSCGTDTSYVYVQDKIYKNKFCAQCNNVTGKYVGCVENKIIKFDFVQIPVTEAIIPKADHCAEIPTASAAYSLLCEKNEPPSDECFVTKTTCYINGYFSLTNNDFHLVNNETIFLREYGHEFPYEEWAWLDQDHIYVCGKKIPQTRYQRIMQFVNDVITEVLIKVSIICIILHLLAFMQLSEYRNLSGKNLASFCVALLLAFLSFDIGPWLPSCEIVAVIEHYCFLCCFTWMLIMSYDVWLSLYRATAKFRTPSSKHRFKFVIYSCIAWTLPLLIVGPALYAELVSSTVVGCDLKPAYGKYDQCFIGHRKPLFFFFFIPASVIFFVNVCLYAHTAFMIYLSQRRTVNPRTRHDFRLYSRLGLLMGLTWTLGSLVTITNSEIIGLLFTVFNMSQGIFIFFGFTFKRKTARGLLQKHRDNKFLSSTFSNFVSATEMASAVSESTATRQTQMEAL